MQARDGVLTLTVAAADDDDGAGPGSGASQGNGLRNLAARAAKVGGGSTLAPNPGGGTLVTWTASTGAAPEVLMDVTG